MNILNRAAGIAVVSGLCALSALGQQPSAGARSLDILVMKTVPDGNYLVNLQLARGEQKVNIEVKDGAGRSVAATEPELRGMIGRFELIGNGVFLVSFHNAQHRATQYWLFRPDGSAVVKEIPDRGERQVAIPVSSDSLTVPPATP